MTPDEFEELENIRRTAERGKAEAELDVCYRGWAIDPFIHILDLVNRIKARYTNNYEVPFG